MHDAKYSRHLRRACFGKGFFLALGGDPGSVGSSKPFVMTSEDGLTWKEPLEISDKEILRRTVWATISLLPWVLGWPTFPATASAGNGSRTGPRR